MIFEELAEPAVSMAEAQAFVRVETGEEEAILAGLVRSASALCEAFIRQCLVARGFRQELNASGEWQRLGRGPVRSIDLVEGIGEDGSATVLPAGAYAIDIDVSGDGWVRLMDVGGARRVRVSGQAGMAEGHTLWRPYRRMRLS